VQYLKGHFCPDLVQRYASGYKRWRAAPRHAAFSPGDYSLCFDKERKTPKSRPIAPPVLSDLHHEYE
jgi:hypothetical protein